MAHPKSNSEARRRLVETADRLFYAEGIRAVGIDRVIAEAGVAKATLYAHFPSKDDLITAVLQHRELGSNAFFEAAMARHFTRTGDHLRSFFAALKEWLDSKEFRGCAFINAAVELADASHPGTNVVRHYKTHFHKMLAGIVSESVGRSSSKTASAIALLVEGAIVMAQITRDTTGVAIARDAAETLVAAARAGK